MTDHLRSINADADGFLPSFLEDDAVVVFRRRA